MLPIDTSSADEQAAEVRAKVEGWQLFWRFFWSVGLIAGTVGVASLIAHWARA
ncbi:MAG TPA: hypothetical protein VGP62_12725 [Bryobacteraceae bacterium]|jgi:hypothetical protein|nr:hypothetical protein [Bryobacteraceae bacterium]